MLFYFSPIFLEHQTGRHPENPGRLALLESRLDGYVERWRAVRPDWSPATPEQLQRVHSPQYIESIRALCESGGGRLDPDTVVSHRSFDAACLASGAVLDAVTRIVRGEDRVAFCAVRPPGHHAVADEAMGFCLFNHIAVGAAHATQQLGLERVLIVDWDVHHGNGTQEIFWEDPRVGFFSMHRSPFYPESGEADEVGGGPGTGTTHNLPIRYGTPPDGQLTRFAEELTSFADRIRPELVLISAGFDSHLDDPIGSLDLETRHFHTLTEIVKTIAARYAAGRIVSVLEGGYNPRALTESIETHLESLANSSPAC